MRVSVTQTSRLPAKSSTQPKRLAEPKRSYSESTLVTSPVCPTLLKKN